MKKMTGKNTLMLFLTAFIWGTAFVAQSVGMDYIGPFTFTCVRSLIGGIFTSMSARHILGLEKVPRVGLFAH